MEEDQSSEQLQPVGEEGDEEPKAKELTKDEQAQLLRLTVDTVGKGGEPGERIQNVTSVGMLSEGWDAKTVTHIMGLRALYESVTLRAGDWARFAADFLRG